MQIYKSKHLISLYNSDSDKFLVFHKYFGNPRVVNHATIDLINLFDHCNDTSMLHRYCNGNVDDFITELLNANFLLRDNSYDDFLLAKMKRKYLDDFVLGKTVDHITLGVSELCNFNCNHCILYRGKTSLRSKNILMNWPIAKQCINFYVDILKKKNQPLARIHFGNAEPLLNWNIIKKCLFYCKTIKDLSFEFVINSNLSLLNEYIIRTLKDHKVKILASLDGTRESNDLVRKTKAGNGTFSIILSKIRLLHKMKYPIDNLSITCTDNNIHHLSSDIIDFAYNNGIKDISFDYDLINQSSVPLKHKIRKLNIMNNYAKRKDISFSGTWSNPFGKLLLTNMNNEIHGFCSASDGKLLAFSPDGCIKACGYSNSIIGHIEDKDKLFRKDNIFYKNVKKNLPRNNPSCTNCYLEGFCNGQCLCTIESSFQQGKNLFYQMCELYKSMTEQLLTELIQLSHQPKEGYNEEGEKNRKDRSIKNLH